MQLHARATIPAYQPNVIALPCAIEARYLARRVLRDDLATDADIDLAIETLSQSPDWMDINLARMMREQRRNNAQIAAEEAERARSEQAFIDLARPIVEANARLKCTVRNLNRALAICAGVALTTIIGAAAVKSTNNTLAQAVEWRASL